MLKASTIGLNFKNVGIKWLISFILLGISQIVFWLVNRSYFNLESESSILIILGNIIFIIASIFIYLSVFLVFSFIPVINTKLLKYSLIYKKILSLFWAVPTFIMLVLNFIDVFWYSTTGKRTIASGLEVFLAVPSKASFVASIIKTYWIPVSLLLLCLVGLIYLGFWLDKLWYKKLENNFSYKYKATSKSMGMEVLVFLLVGGAVFGFIRRQGYWGSNALKLIHATKFTTMVNTAVVLNTPFIMVRTYHDGDEALPDIDFYPEETLNSLFSVDRYLPTSNTNLDEARACIKNSGVKNILILEVESLSAEYTSTFNPDSKNYTPFIDSLIKKSITYLGWANGDHSMVAPLAINSSFPQYARHNSRYFLSSSDFNTPLDSLSSRLKKEGYDTLFFFPDENGSMYLDKYAKQTEFDSYYGKTEYDRDNPGNTDGTGDIRGVWDDPYLQYVVKKIDETYHRTNKPFYSYVITASSHYDFSIPKEYESVFEPGPLIVHQSVRYADWAIKNFFDSISKTDWAKDTLFIILADHTGMSEGGYWATFKGSHETPVMFYLPGAGCKPIINTDFRVSQVDIFPTVLDLLGIKSHILAYGRSIFDPEHENLGITSDNINHVFLKDNYLVVCFDNCSKIEVYDVDKDKMNTKDLMLEFDSLKKKEKQIISSTISEAKASVQQFINRLVARKTSVPKEDLKETKE